MLLRNSHHQTAVKIGVNKVVHYYHHRKIKIMTPIISAAVCGKLVNILLASLFIVNKKQIKKSKSSCIIFSIKVS
jgi:hypothetical protein